LLVDDGLPLYEASPYSELSTDSAPDRAHDRKRGFSSEQSHLAYSAGTALGAGVRTLGFWGEEVTRGVERSSMSRFHVRSEKS
jgi:hypothetical protein